MKVGLVDYEAGNLFSVRHALGRVGADVMVVRGPEDLGVGPVVLPGVGAFGSGLAVLRERGLDVALADHVRQGRPLFGICLGMQLLAGSSAERGEHVGLGLVGGRVDRLDGGVRIPHMGWNRVAPSRENPVVIRPMFAYFAHSYALPGDGDSVAATVEHGGPRAAALWREHLWACQFHPEKSGPEGLAVLARFVEARWR